MNSKNITKIIVNNALICQNCFNVIPAKITVELQDNLEWVIPDEFYYSIGAKCNHCNQKFYHFMVDGNIAELISVLNRRGYYTDYSCQGHSDIRYYADGAYDDYIKKSGVIPISKYYLYRYTHPYVSINGDKKLSKKFYNFILKHGWVVEVTDYDGTNDDTYQVFINDEEKAIGSTKFCIRIPGKSIDEVLTKYIGKHSSKSYQKQINKYLEWWFKTNIEVLCKDLKEMKGRS